MRRARYQHGCLQRVERKKGPATWEYRWRETQLDGGRKQRKVVVGTVLQYRTAAEAQRAIAALRVTINQEAPRSLVESITVGTLIQHYRERELWDEERGRKAFSTRAAYECYLSNWIQPRWKEYRLGDVKAVAVEDWLRQLPLSDGSKAKVRNIMSALFNHAIRHEWVEKNPITRVRQSAKRQRIPDVLEVGELRALLAALNERERLMVLLVSSTALRAGEFLALKWSDVDLQRLQLNVVRSIVQQVIGPCKTEASRKPVPLDACLAEDLSRWRSRSLFSGENDWVFASEAVAGTQPLWPENLRRKIRVAAKSVGITKRIGFHTFRHTFSTLLKANGEDVKVVQELLRHANSRITMDTYVQATTPAKREAQNKVVVMIRGGQAAAV